MSPAKSPFFTGPGAASCFVSLRRTASASGKTYKHEEFAHMSNVSYELSRMKRELSEICYLFFKVLANPTRLAILEILREKPRNVTEIAESLKQEQSMISHNLKTLERCRFVFSERKEKQRIYSLNHETVEPLSNCLLITPRSTVQLAANAFQKKASDS